MEALLAYLKDIERILIGVKILEDVYNEVGPYNDGRLTDETRFKMNDYFGFDDSE